MGINNSFGNQEFGLECQNQNLFLPDDGGGVQACILSRVVE